MAEESAIRLAKLNKIKQAKLNPYPAKAKRTNTCQEMLADFAKLKGREISLVGRIYAIRSHGGSTFVQVQDGTARIQAYLRRDILGEDKYKSFSSLDMGDFVQLTGKLFTTKKGEKTLEVSDYSLLTKSLKPLPEKWHGLKDVEERFRKRYLDLAVNPEVRKRFELRSAMIEKIRQILITKGYMEVDTPILQTIYGGGFAKPFKTHHNALDIPLYLRISDELYLKRLIVGGFEKVFEFCKDFRNEGIDLSHNPEFTLLEIMTAYQNYEFSMDLVEEIYLQTAQEVLGGTEIEYQGQKINLERPWKRLTMVESIKEYTGADFTIGDSCDQVREKALKLGLDKEELAMFQTTGEMIAYIFEEKVEEKLIQPTIIYNYPVETSPLAKKCADDPRFVERFEHFIIGSEAGNHYSELNDPVDLRQRFVEEKKKEQSGFDEAHQTDEEFIEAIEHGMPPVTGIGIGIDRMAMLFTNTNSIKEVILFPTMKPKGDDGHRLTSTADRNKTLLTKSQKMAKVNLSLTRDDAFALLKEHLKDEKNILHSRETEVIMRALAKKLGEDEELWAVTGLLHDLDWEETQDKPAEHGKVTADILRAQKFPEVGINAIQAHSYEYNKVIERQTKLDHAVACAESITGLIFASALVHPDKKLANVKAKSLKKKMKDKSFAAKVSREMIGECDQLGLSLDEFIELSLKAMQEISDELGL
ncbi:lysine--tRNA ligase [Patescibacteria group bacterium]|nr:lysine--tRNA ligase [Patescibacteria group bacterium]